MAQSDVFDFSKLVEAWGSPLVSRSDVGRFSGFLLHPRTMANLDSLGKGPGKITIGGRVCYETEKLARWMQQRMEEKHD